MDGVKCIVAVQRDDGSVIYQAGFAKVDMEINRDVRHSPPGSYIPAYVGKWRGRTRRALRQVQDDLGWANRQVVEDVARLVDAVLHFEEPDEPTPSPSAAPRQEDALGLLAELVGIHDDDGEWYAPDEQEDAWRRARDLVAQYAKGLIVPAPKEG